MDRPTNRLVYKINPVTATAEGDQVDAWSDGYGRQHVIVDSGGGTPGILPAALGQATMANSLPVVIASNQSTFPVTVTAGAKGATTAATITSTANGVDHQGLDVVEQFQPGYENNTINRAIVQQSNSYTNITSATTTQIKGAAGFLHRITINAAVASATVTIYDNTVGSGTKIGTITMPATLLASQMVLDFDVLFITGLTIVTVGAQDLTISWS